MSPPTLLPLVTLLLATACAAPAGPGPDAVLAGRGFATPESALHDPETDAWLVANIDGDPFAKDDNGFISRVGPTGARLATRWIDGRNPEVTLHAPKGMALTATELWVADIDEVRRFDRRTGAPRGSVPVAGATFLNDVAVGADGSLLVTDSGFAPGFQPSGTDAIWRIDPTDGSVRAFARGADLGQPNGIWVDAGGVYAVTWATGRLLAFSPTGEQTDALALPTAQLDGLVRLPDGRFVVTSWQGKCAYVIAGGQATPWLQPQLDAPADLGLDLRRRCLLIPEFQKHELRVVRWP